MPVYRSITLSWTDATACPADRPSPCFVMFSHGVLDVRKVTETVRWTLRRVSNIERCVRQANNHRSMNEHARFIIGRRACMGGRTPWVARCTCLTHSVLPRCLLVQSIPSSSLNCRMSINCDSLEPGSAGSQYKSCLVGRRSDASISVMDDRAARLFVK